MQQLFERRGGERELSHELNTLKQELQQTERELADFYEAHPEIKADRDRLMGGSRNPVEKEEDKLEARVERIEFQLTALSTFEQLLKQQHAENQQQFRGIQDDSKTSSRQNALLTVISSTVSLIIGWLLSLIGTPATFFHR